VIREHEGCAVYQRVASARTALSDAHSRAEMTADRGGIVRASRGCRHRKSSSREHGRAISCFSRGERPDERYRGTDRRGGGSTSVISNRENSLAPRRHSRAFFFSRFLAAVVVVVDARSSRIIVRAKTLFRFLRLPLDPLDPPPLAGPPLSSCLRIGRICAPGRSARYFRNAYLYAPLLLPAGVRVRGHTSGNAAGERTHRVAEVRARVVSDYSRNWRRFARRSVQAIPRDISRYLASANRLIVIYGTRDIRRSIRN